jgi:hypothetical protein
LHEVSDIISACALSAKFPAPIIQPFSTVTVATVLWRNGESNPERLGANQLLYLLTISPCEVLVYTNTHRIVNYEEGKSSQKYNFLEVGRVDLGGTIHNPAKGMRNLLLTKHGLPHLQAFALPKNAYAQPQ